MLGSIQKGLALAQFLKSRVFAVAILAVALAFTVYSVNAATRIVQIREGDEVQTYTTMNDSPEEILEEHGYVTMAYDQVEFTGFYDKLGEITINRAFPVRVVCDGQKSVHMVTEGTVSDVLEAADIVLADQDHTDQPLNKPVEENDTIIVTRQRVVTREQKTELPFETLTTRSSLVASGREKVLVVGEPGFRVETFAQRIVDGVKEEETLLSDDIVKAPVNREVLVGFAASPVSQLDFEWAFDENGEPAEYVNVLRGQRAAGYSARPGARTASGRAAIVGHVAVNPREIPYGSKLFIQSTDGKFVYGYAIAADTGTALAQDIIDVDLFYGSYAESALNGIKSVDIFILE